MSLFSKTLKNTKINVCKRLSDLPNEEEIKDDSILTFKLLFFFFFPYLLSSILELLELIAKIDVMIPSKRNLIHIYQSIPRYLLFFNKRLMKKKTIQKHLFV